nr:hypothetical protein [Tanacetum cinerariifolium]
MTDVMAPTGQALTMALPVRSNDQCLPHIRWVQTGYLKFSAKGTKREVFRMPVPGSLIIADLREVSYYQEYLANVVKHRWFLSSEPARKPNPTAQKVRIHILQKPKRMNTKVPQPSSSIEIVVDVVVHKEWGDRLVQRNHRDTIAQTRFNNVSKLSNDSLIVIALEITSMKRKVKKIDKKQRSRNHKLKRLYKVGLIARVDSSKDEQSLGEDASKQGRKINDIDADEDITLVNDQDDAEMFNVNDLHGEEVFVEKEVANKEVNDEVQKVVEEVVEDTNTAKLIVNAAHVSAAGEVNAASIVTTTSKPKAKGIVLQEPSESITTTTKKISSKKSQDKGKAIMIKEPVKAKKKVQIMLDKETAKNQQDEFDEEERIAREKGKKELEANIALIKEWDDIQAKINADYQLAQRLQTKKQEDLTIEEKATLFKELLEKRRKHFAAKAA